jgi:hypothetical protein
LCREIGDDGGSDIGNGWRAQVPGSVRAMLVVMHGVLVQDHVQVPGPAISIRSVTSDRAVRTQRPASAFACGLRGGILITSIPALGRTVPNAPVGDPGPGRLWDFCGFFGPLGR